MEDMDLEEATEDTVVKDLPKLVMAMGVGSVDMVDTEDLVVTEDMVQKEAMEDTVARDLLMPATATVVTEGDTEVSEEVMQADTEVSEEDTEEVMEVTMVDMDTEGKFCAQHPFDSPEPSSFIMSYRTFFY